MEKIKIADRLYSLIYADPPWLYKDKCHAGNRGAEYKYRCTGFDDLCRLDIPAEKDSVCLMWATYPQLHIALHLMEAWGFIYKTVAFTWVKTNRCGTIYMGMGSYTRSNAEVCLLGIRGRGLKRKDAGIYQTQLHERLRHSQKPHAFRDEIVRLYGDVSRIELFARDKIDGWDAWGDEL